MRFIKKILPISLVAVVLFGFSVQNSMASCAVSSLQEHYDRADLVVRGTAIELNDPWIGEEHYSFSVDTFFKGEGPSRLKITGDQSSKGMTSVDFKIEEGKRYLLFLKGDADGLLRTDACSGNKEMQGPLSDEEIKVLGKGIGAEYAKPANSLFTNYIFVAIVSVVLGGIGIAFLFLKKELHREHHGHIE